MCDTGFCTHDEPARVEPDTAFIDSDDDYPLDQWANEHGYVYTPGQWPDATWGI